MNIKTTHCEKTYSHRHLTDLSMNCYIIICIITSVCMYHVVVH